MIRSDSNLAVLVAGPVNNVTPVLGLSPQRLLASQTLMIMYLVVDVAGSGDAPLMSFVLSDSPT